MAGNTASSSLPSQTVMELPIPETVPVELQDPMVDTVPDEVNQAPQPQIQVEEIPLRRSIRQRRLVIPPDYMVYLGEQDYDIGCVVDPVTYKDAVTCEQSDLWLDAM